MSVAVNPPKTPVTKGSNGIATATIPNVCKMPGPPAPFVPVPLPNIGKSGKSPQGYTKDVTIEGNAVAIKGATFESMGDIASKGTGGGLISANCEGITKFVGPGSMDVKFEGGNVQFLSDPMLNNCGPGGSPPNAATLLGVLQKSGLLTAVMAGVCPVCGRNHGPLRETQASKESCGELATAWKAANGMSTMLGVAHCRIHGRGARYAEKSGEDQIQRFYTAASAFRTRGDGTAPIPDDPLQTFRDRLGANFEPVWQQGGQRHQRFLDDMANNEAAYEPGNCAGQKVIALLMDRGGIPGAMTEQWYSKKGRPTGGRMAYLSRGPLRGPRAGEPGRMNPRRPRVDNFAHGETTPPCRTCELILPYLLCTEDRTQCSD
jgi:hypothetical protein